MAFQFAVGGAFIPFVTLFFRDRGLDMNQISRIFAASSITLLVSPFLWGMLADRVVPLNRLFTIINGLVLISLVWMATQREFAGLLLSYTLFYACFNPTLWLINALCFHHLPNPQKQFGTVRAWGSLGWIVPFLPISLVLAGAPRVDFAFVIYLSMICSAVMAAFSFWLPHTPPGARRTGPDHGHGIGYGRAVRRLLADLDYLALLVSMFLMAGSFSLMTFYSPALLQDIGVPRPWIGPVQAIAVVCEILLFQLQPGLVRRWNYAAVIMAGCLALCLRHLLFGLSTNAWVLSGSYILAGMVIVFFNMVVSVLANGMAAREVRATAQTLLLFVGQGMGPLFANGVTTRLTGQASGGLKPVFFFGASLAAIAAVVIGLRARHLNSGIRP